MVMRKCFKFKDQYVSPAHGYKASNILKKEVGQYYDTMSLTSRDSYLEILRSILGIEYMKN